MMSKHTPGPWAVGTETDGALGYVYCDNFAGSAVALVYGHKGMNYSLLPRQEVIANARLIASAPELLDLLWRALPYMADSDMDGHLGVYDEARAAIAKATGDAA